MLFTLGRLHVVSLSRYGTARMLACQGPSSSLFLSCSSSFPSSSSSPLRAAWIGSNTCGSAYYSTTVIVSKNSYSRNPDKQFNREQGPSGNRRTTQIGSSGSATMGARNQETDPRQRSTATYAVRGRQTRTDAIGDHKSSRNNAYSATRARTPKLRGTSPQSDNDNNSKGSTMFGGTGNTKSSRSGEYSPMRTPKRRGLSLKRDDDNSNSSSMGRSKFGVMGNFNSSRSKEYSPTRNTTTTKRRGQWMDDKYNSKKGSNQQDDNFSRRQGAVTAVERGSKLGRMSRPVSRKNVNERGSNHRDPMSDRDSTRRDSMTSPTRATRTKGSHHLDNNFSRRQGAVTSVERGTKSGRMSSPVSRKNINDRGSNHRAPISAPDSTRRDSRTTPTRATRVKGSNRWDDNFSRGQGAVTAVERGTKPGRMSSPVSRKSLNDRGSNHYAPMSALDSTRRDSRTPPTRATRVKKQLTRPPEEHTLGSTEMTTTTRKRTRTSVVPLDVPTNLSKGTIGPKSKNLTTFPHDRWEIIVTCLPGLESILSDELHALQIDHMVISCGAKLHSSASTTTTSTAVDTLMKCHLFLGSASHIYLQCLDTFKARGLAELRRKISLLPWDSILPPTVTFQPIRVTVTKSKLYHTRAIEDRVINGIYEALGLDVPEYSNINDDDDDDESTIDFEEPKKNQQLLLQDRDKSPHTSARGNIGNDDTNAIRLDVRLDRDEVSISIDTSLTPLHRRGYRLETAKAPLREDLAFALLYCAGWRPTFGDTTTNLYSGLLDAFCGSGTIAIEGAAMAAGLPPGRLRPAPLTGTLFYNSKRWNALVKEASDPNKNSALDKDAKIIIAASDRDEGAVDAAQSNAVRAGVLSWMNIQCLAFSSHPWLDERKGSQAPPKKLLIASNLPFGKRISPNSGKNAASSDKPLLHLYQTLGHRVNRLLNSGSDVRAVFLGDDPKLIRRTDIKSGFNVGFKSQHGGTSVTALVTCENNK